MGVSQTVYTKICMQRFGSSLVSELEKRTITNFKLISTKKEFVELKIWCATREQQINGKEQKDRFHNSSLSFQNLLLKKKKAVYDICQDYNRCQGECIKILSIISAKRIGLGRGWRQ